MDRTAIPIAVILLAAGCIDSIAATWTTRQNRSIFVPATHAVTNGVPGLSSPVSQLMVSGVSASSAQGGNVTIVNTQAWARIYTGPGYYDQMLDSVVDASNHVTVVGGTYRPGADIDFVTIRYSPDGVALWTKIYDGPAHGEEFARKIAVDGAANLYVAGNSKGLASGVDVALIKYSPRGEAIWTNRYSTAGAVDDYPNSVAADSAGNAYLAVHSFYPVDPVTPTPDDQSVIIKYDLSGTPVWTNRHTALQLAIDASGNLTVAGRSENPSGFLAAKFRADGTPLWSSVYFRSFDTISAMALDPSGRVILTGDSSYDFYSTVAFTGDGAPLWTNLLAHPSYQGGNVPMVTTDLAGNVFVTGGSADTVGDAADFTTLKISNTGTVLWTNRFREENVGNSAPGGSRTDSAGNFYLAGHSLGTSPTNRDMYVVKYAGDGTRLWTNRFDGPGHQLDLPADIELDFTGATYLSGLSETAGRRNGVTVKFADYILYTPPPDFFGTDTISVTVIDASGRRTTSTVSVVVAPPLRFDTSPAAFGFGATGLRMRVVGAIGTSPVILEASTNLVHWESVLTNPPSAGAAEFLVPGAARSRQFFRATQ